MSDPAATTDPTDPMEPGRREPWSAPRLARLDAAATANGGVMVSDGADGTTS